LKCFFDAAADTDRKISHRILSEHGQWSVHQY